MIDHARAVIFDTQKDEASCLDGREGGRGLISLHPGLRSFAQPAEYWHHWVMALMVPATFPHDLTKKPRLNGEALVYVALASALDVGWWVLYDRRIPGSRRRVDFIAANPDRGILAIEVKGGQVHDRRGSFRQLVSRTPLWRKKIDPFGQLNAGLRDLYAAADVKGDTLPVHRAIWFPEMGQGGLRWEPSPHILTRELLEPERLRGLVATAFPQPATEWQQVRTGRVISVLKGVR